MSCQTLTSQTKLFFVKYLVYSMLCSNLSLLYLGILLARCHSINLDEIYGKNGMLNVGAWWKTLYFLNYDNIMCKTIQNISI